MTSKAVHNIPEDLIAELPKLKDVVNRSEVFLKVHRGTLNGRSIDRHTTSKAVIIDSEGNVTFFAGKKGFFAWEWTECVSVEKSLCEWAYNSKCKPHQVELKVSFPAAAARARAVAECTVNFLQRSSEFLPNSPGFIEYEGIEFRNEITKLEISTFDPENSPPSGSGFKTIDGLVSTNETETAIISHFITGDVLRFPRADYMGTLSVDQTAQEAFLSGTLHHIWWNQESGTLTLVRDISPDSQALVLEGHSHRKLAAMPFVTLIRGVMGKRVFHNSACICFPGNKDIEIYKKKGVHKKLARELTVIERGGVLVLTGEKQNVCAMLSGKPQELANHMRLDLKKQLDCHHFLGMVKTKQHDGLKRDLGGHHFLGMVKTKQHDGLKRDLEYPALLDTQSEIRSVISPLPLNFAFDDLERLKDGSFTASTESGKVWLRVAEADALNFRKATVHNSVVTRLDHEDNQKMAFLYGTLNELRVQRFMRLLYSDVVQLYREMQADPEPKNVLERFNSQGPPDEESQKTLISKLVLLAQTIPQLKRNLEQLGTFYPHQVNQWDSGWLEETFGSEIATKWSNQQGRRQTEKLRGFVRNTQSSLWRSLSEIERGLAKLEPVYSETLRSARKTNDIKQAGISGAGGLALGGALFLAGGGWILAGMGSLNMANTIMSIVSRNGQLEALLTDHGPEVLRWWEVFSQAFRVQVHESKAYLVQHFDGLSKRDAEIFQQLMQSDPDLQHRVKTQLRKQVLLESEQRFQPLWTGGKQVEQDLIELLEEIESSGTLAVVNANSFSSMQN